MRTPPQSRGTRRRQFLAALGSAAVAGLAGCSRSYGGEAGEPTGDATTTPGEGSGTTDGTGATTPGSDPSTTRPPPSGTGTASEAPAARVEATETLQFQPDAVTVDAGATVEWLTVGSIPHTVTAYGDQLPAGAEYFASGGFESEAAARAVPDAGLLAEGETFRHTFDVAGTYEYFCVPHEAGGMAGTVEVLASEDPGGGY